MGPVTIGLFHCEGSSASKLGPACVSGFRNNHCGKGCHFSGRSSGAVDVPSLRATVKPVDFGLFNGFGQVAVEPKEGRSAPEFSVLAADVFASFLGSRGY